MVVVGGRRDRQDPADRLSLAFQTAQTINDAEDRSLALGAIAEAQAEAGDVSGAQDTFSLAFQTAQTIADEFYRSRALRAIAEAQAEAGDVSGAFQTAEMIADEFSQPIMNETTLRPCFWGRMETV